MAPLSYSLCPDTVLDIPFKNLELDCDLIKSGYIQVGKIGHVFQRECETVIGTMPDIYLNDALELLEKLRTIIKI